MRISIISDGKYGERAFELIKSKFPYTKMVFVPEFPANQFLDDFEMPDSVEDSINQSDLIITYVRHPDITLELCDYEKPVVLAINFGEGFYNQAKEVNDDVHMPPSMCRMVKETGIEAIDVYCTRFGIPEYRIKLSFETDPPTIEKIDVLRESPCGATIRSLDQMKGKKVIPETFNQFGLNVSQECREPMSLLLKRSHMGESAGSIHTVQLMKNLKEQYPKFIENDETMGSYFDKVMHDYEHPKKTHIYR